MTSGQGSAPESGQPPYGQPPEGPPPYGGPPPGQPPQAPPYGRPPPGGYPPYGPPGYMPAPSAPTGWGSEAPRALERPVTVRAGLGAFIASLVLSLVGSVFSLLNFDNILEQALAQVDTSTVPNRDQALEFARSFAVIGVVIGLVILAVFALFVWFAWRGRNWARIVLWVLGGLQLVFGLIGLGLSSANPIADAYPFLAALSWFQYLFTAAGVVLLALKPSNDWFRYRKWLQATGQPG